MSYTEVVPASETPIYPNSPQRSSRQGRPILRISAQTSPPKSPSKSSAERSSASGSQVRLEHGDNDRIAISRTGGRGHADASFPTTSSASPIGDIQLPVSQPLGKAARGPTPRAHHQRAHTTAVASLSPSTFIFPRTHSRTLSSISHYHDSVKSPRARVLSLSALAVGNSPKAETLTPVAVEGDETIGSFAPTSCPRQRLRSMLGPVSRPNLFTVARRRLAIGAKASSPYKPHIFDSDDDDVSSLDDESPPESPIPSICRTPSSESPSEADYFPTAPSSAGPLTPTHSHSTIHSLRQSSFTSLTPPALVALEDRSKFRVRTSCSSCHRPGSNYPCCPRCGEMWCSRECRLQSTGGKRHICASR